MSGGANATPDDGHAGSSPPPEPVAGSTAPRRLLWSYRIVAVVLGMIAAWRHRNGLTPDGVSYLDLGDAILAGGPADALNSYWSPAYPFIVAVVRSLSGFSPELELPMAHLANFFVYLGFVVAFEAVLRELSIRVGDPVGLREPVLGTAPTGSTRTTALGLVGLGYPLFLLCSLQLIGLEVVTPDLAVAALALAAVALTLAVSRHGGLGLGAALGLVLGLAYLTKTAMLVIGGGILACGWVVARDRRSRRAMAAATLAMTGIAGSFIAVLSIEVGRVTIGDSGRLNYAFHVNRVPRFSHAPADLGRHGVLKHPVRTVAEDPPVYEFAGPIGGTYPLWYDPGYWYEGVEKRFDPDQQLAAFERNLDRWREEILPPMVWGVTALAIVLAASLSAARGGSWRRVRRGLDSHLVPLAVGVGPLLLYLLVHVRARYVGGFVLLAGLGLLGLALGLPRRPAWLGALAVTAGLLVTATTTLDVVTGPAADRARRHLRVAAALHRAGVEPGSPVGVIGNAYTEYWARLGRFRIIADIPKTETRRFWSADPHQQAIALDGFRRTGVRAVVATSRARLGRPWRPLGRTRRWAVIFEPHEPTLSARD
jgi:hypothetical protein